MKPAVRAMGAIKKKNGDEQKRRKSEKQENQRRMLQALVVHLHGEHHHDESRNGPYQLLQQEFVSRPVALLRHHSGGAEDHDQPDENQGCGHSKHPAIDADPLGHRESISSRRHEDMEQFRPWIIGEGITGLVPTVLAGGAPGVPARPPYCLTARRPSLHHTTWIETSPTNALSP